MPGWTSWMPSFSSSQKDHRQTEASADNETRGARRNSNTDSLECGHQPHDERSKHGRRNSSKATRVPGTQYKDLPEPSAVGQKPSQRRGGSTPTTAAEPKPIAEAASANSHLRDALKTCESQKREMEDIIKQLQAANNRQAADLDQLNLELQSAKKGLGNWQESYTDINRQLKSVKDEGKTVFENLSANLARVSQENEELREEKARMQRRLEDMRQRMEAGDTDLWKSKKLLETRTEELRVAQTFLTTADQHSIADISQMVEELNEEIYQCSVMISDALIEQRAKRTVGRNDDEQAHRKRVCQAMEQRWGRGIVARLLAGVKEEETTLLESLLEHALVAWCCHTIRCFSLESVEFENQCLAMWDGIKQSYETPVARRWFAMTHSQLKAQTRNTGKDGHGALRDLGNLMAGVGWNYNAEGSSTLSSKVEEKVAELTEKAFRIKEAITEGILSAEVDVFYFLPDSPYNQATMRDAYSMDGSSEALDRAEKIVCSTGLGVHCTKEAKQRRGSQEPLYEVVLKPKVLLPSALEPEHE